MEGEADFRFGDINRVARWRKGRGSPAGMKVKLFMVDEGSVDGKPSRGFDKESS
jgi:hypothetical protein